jgi:hypothetical protein
LLFERRGGALQIELLTQSWPAKDKHDIRVPNDSLSHFDADLQTLGTISILDIESWGSTFATDNATIGADVNIVRHDLGLPLVS